MPNQRAWAGKLPVPMPILRPFAWWTVVIWRLCTVEAKVHSGTLEIGGPEAENRWRYVSKFGFGLGLGVYDVRLRLRQPATRHEDAQLDLDIYLDEDWYRVESLPACERASDSLSRKTLHIGLQSAGHWSSWVNGAVEHSVRPHIWYFALSDCRHKLSSKLEIDFEFRARQEDNSEFSVENRHMLVVHDLLLVCSTVFLGGYTVCCRRFQLSTGALHPVIWVLTVAMLLQYTAQLLNASHLRRYKADGIGFWTLSVLAENLSMASQVLHTVLLIIIAKGYTLLRSNMGDVGFMKPVAAAVLLTHSALVGFGKMEDDASHKHHENEGVVGWTILAIRLLLFVWFIRAAQASQISGGLRLHAFLQQFQFAGSLYFLAYPLLFMLVKVFAPYLRQPILQVGVLVMQLASDAWLASLFLSRGTYFRVSTLSALLLPSSMPCKAD